MSMEIEIKRPNITADTDILSTAVVTDDEGKEHEANFGTLLRLHGQEYLESVGSGIYPILLMDDFEDNALCNGITHWDTFEEAYSAKHWSTTSWKESVLTKIEPMDLGSFQLRSRYFTRDNAGHLAFLQDDLTLAAWMEMYIVSKDEKIAFVRWCFEEGKIR